MCEHVFVPEGAIEIGKTYPLAPGPDSVYRHHAGRKALVIQRVDGGPGEDLFEVRWPSGSTFLAAASELKDPADPATPGVDERCIVCGGTKVAIEYAPDPELEWIQHEVGEVPCTNCGNP